MLTGVTLHDPNPFGDQPEGDPTVDDRPTVDVSSDAMTKLRSPFEVSSDAPGHGDRAERR
ncbi:hypothetical protein BDK92_0473 [Micromonospora pisi]|uniref:Uncharacterized protein n=1 Tax=Micromonospora pisi TaxID=589240 RepID=A0A495JDV3_9ACTN|nr:hypothetical protein [Micromonospora pisi]RKR86249.1 hypothetical protein BDK92_0473 [Micromonospora pisi]